MQHKEAFFQGQYKLSGNLAIWVGAWQSRADLPAVCLLQAYAAWCEMHPDCGEAVRTVRNLLLVHCHVVGCQRFDLRQCMWLCAYLGKLDMAWPLVTACQCCSVPSSLFRVRVKLSVASVLMFFVQGVACNICKPSDVANLATQAADLLGSVDMW